MRTSTDVNVWLSLTIQIDDVIILMSILNTKFLWYDKNLCLVYWQGCFETDVTIYLVTATFHLI